VVYQGSGGFATAGAAGEVAGEVTGELIQLLKILAEPKTRTELQETLGLKGQANFRDRYLKPALDNGFIVMTNPKKPTSRLQKYRLTEKGRKFLELLEKGKGRS
jgi:ATP-dependent DNA helicase RecG